MTPKDIKKKIREAERNNLKELDLSVEFGGDSSKRLTSIPPEIFELDHLETLNLMGHAITSIPDSITQLQNLKVLNLVFNDLTSVSEGIGRLHNLIRLNLWAARDVEIEAPQSISELKHLID